MKMSETVAKRAVRTKPASRKVTARKPGSREASAPEASAPKKAPGRTSPSSPPPSLAERQAEKRDAILNAALDEFSASGFASARLDDVARRAGVAKGTIYLYFRDKESLFQELVRSMVSPIVGRIEAAGAADMPPRFVAEAIAALFANEIFGTRREALLRLIITEGPRFPRIAEFYFHEVIERVVPAMRGLMSRAVARGELKHDALARFPQLLVAPALMAVVWSGLFGRFAPLDIRELLRAHIDLLFGERSAT